MELSQIHAKWKSMTLVQNTSNNKRCFFFAAVSMSWRRLNRLLFHVSVRRFGRGAGKKVIIDHSFFSNGIVSDNHAWLGGMLVTDGHFKLRSRCIKFSLRLDDYKMVDNVACITNSNSLVTFNIDSTGSAYASISLNSKQMVNDILKLFPCDWRSKADTLSSSVSLFDASSFPFVNSYIRGVSDGDGSFAIHKASGIIRWQLSSNSSAFIHGIKELINSHCFGYDCTPKVYSTGNGRHIIQITNQGQVLVFATWMYTTIDLNMLCKRKYHRYLLLRNLVGHGHTTKDRVAIMQMHQIQELVARIETCEHIMACLNRQDTPFHFTPKFIEREAWFRETIELWKTKVRFA